MQPVRYVIAGYQRSGTTVTHYCLRGHPAISSLREEVTVDPLFTKGIATFTHGGGSYEDRVAGLLRLFDAVAGIGATDATQAYGVKIALGSARDTADLANALREFLPSVKVIFVHRADLVAQFGSLQRAVKSKKWDAWSAAESDRDARDMLRLDPEHFRRYAAECLKAIGQMRLLAESHALCEFSYEHDIEPGFDHRKLFSFLGVPMVEPTWMRMHKVAPPPDRYIENYAELRDILAQTAQPSPDHLRALARQRMREQAAQNNPFFLLSRATARLEASRFQECQDDLLAALEGEFDLSLDLAMRGRCFAMLEQTRDHGDERERVDGLLRRLQEEHGDRAAFLFSRGKWRHAGGRHGPASDDLARALDRGLDTWAVEPARQMLERCRQLAHGGERARGARAGRAGGGRHAEA